MEQFVRHDKRKDMIRSVLPSKNREAARAAKAIVSRANRRGVRGDLQHVDFETTSKDLTREAYQSDNVRWRRDGDKLNHFMRWCHAITAGMTPQEKLDYVRALLPRNLIGDHAYSHWETEVGIGRQFSRFFNWRPRRSLQSFYDSARSRLRRALQIDPDLQRRINTEIKHLKQPDEPRRLLLGIHDVDDFVAVIVELHASPPGYRQSWAPSFAIERQVLIDLVSEIDHWKQKGGAEPPFGFLGPALSFAA